MLQDIAADESVGRILALMKVGADTTTRPEVMQVVDIFRAKIVDVGEKAVIIEVTGDEDKVAVIAQLLRPYGVKELVQTGKIAMVRSR